MGDVLASLLQDLEGLDHNIPLDPRVRAVVAARARGHCEYCLLPTGGQFEIDHVIPRRRWRKYLRGDIAPVQPQSGRRGPDHVDNFAWACPFCNNRKNQRLFYPARGPGIVRLFDPRYDIWGEHFFFANEYSVIWGRTPIGQATVDALAMNDLRPESLAAQRLALILVGGYPPDWARQFLVTER